MNDVREDDVVEVGYFNARGTRSYRTGEVTDVGTRSFLSTSARNPCTATWSCSACSSAVASRPGRARARRVFRRSTTRTRPSTSSRESPRRNGRATGRRGATGAALALHDMAILSRFAEGHLGVGAMSAAAAIMRAVCESPPGADAAFGEEKPSE